MGRWPTRNRSCTCTLAIIGPLDGDWWKLFTNEFAYIDGVYAFVAIADGRDLRLAAGAPPRRRRWCWRCSSGAGATGALVAERGRTRCRSSSGGNAAALALLAAWAAPDLVAARAGAYYEGDLLGAGAIAALLLALPFARPGGELAGGRVGRRCSGLAVGLGTAPA